MTYNDSLQMFQYISVICMSVSMPARKIQDGKKGKRNDILWTSMDDISGVGSLPMLFIC